MILFATPGNAAPLPRAEADQPISPPAIYVTLAASPPPDIFKIEGPAPMQAEIKPTVQDVLEEFDWQDPKANKEFIRLEQLVLARKATESQTNRYRSMKSNRDSIIFADRCVRDYAEVQRLKKLAEKLDEIQQYLRPIRF